MDEAETTYTMELPPASEFAFFPARLLTKIHAFLALASLGNLCPQKLLHWGTQHSVPSLFLQAPALVVNAAHCNASTGITLTAVAPSGEYQSLLYLSFTKYNHSCQNVHRFTYLPPSEPHRRWRHYEKWPFVSVVGRHANGLQRLT